MAPLPWSLFNLSILCLLLYASMSQVMALQCYICHTDDNEACMGELRNCSTDQAYDRCMTTIYKNPKDGKHIKKECALAPCQLRGLGNLNFAHFKTNCASSHQDCMFCCTGDGCNKDGALGLAPLSAPLLCLTLLCVHLIPSWPLH